MPYPFDNHFTGNALNGMYIDGLYIFSINDLFLGKIMCLKPVSYDMLVLMILIAYFYGFIGTVSRVNRQQALHVGQQALYHF